MLEQEKLDLLKLDNVVAVGERNGILEVSVTQKLPESKLRSGHVVPKSLQGVITNVTATGPIYALENTGRYRPAPGGVSVGHPSITAGTLGTWFMHEGEWHILSNNHVLAASNEAEIGDLIIQPGTADGGTTGDEIARLTKFVPIIWDDSSPPIPDPPDIPDCPIARWYQRFGRAGIKLFGSGYKTVTWKPQAEDNRVDCAMAKALGPDLVNPEILEIGRYEGIFTDYRVDLSVRKTGRTTGYTESKIAQLGVSVKVGYGDGKSAIFRDQIAITNDGFGAGGDSGSGILHKQALTALLFAGSSALIIASKIRNVERGLGVTF